MNDFDYTNTLEYGLVRRRTAIDTCKGEVSAFWVQLEANTNPGSSCEAEWVDIARFDHQPMNPQGHDICSEGLHMDLRHPQMQDPKVQEFPSVDLAHAPRYCERYFDENYEDIVQRYLDWCDLDYARWERAISL